MAPSINLQAPGELPSAPKIEGKKRPVKYKTKFHLSITDAMSDALGRLTSGPHAVMTAAQMGRMALHQFLVANDPLYARLVSNGHGQ
jgi:hypothetical protein